MYKKEMDYDQLFDNLSKKTYKLSEVSNRLEKVAFDIVKFKDSENPDELWQIQNADDGEYIVARYNSDEKLSEAKSNWDVIVKDANINIFYKNSPITKIAASSLNIQPEDLSTIKSFLPNKLASDKSFVSALLSTLNKSSKERLEKEYPELF
jgi:hypothetical protein